MMNNINPAIESVLLWEVLAQGPGVIRFEKCDPGQVLSQIFGGKKLSPDCPDCGERLLQQGSTFFCPCKT